MDVEGQASGQVSETEDENGDEAEGAGEEPGASFPPGTQLPPAAPLGRNPMAPSRQRSKGRRRCPLSWLVGLCVGEPGRFPEELAIFPETVVHEERPLPCLPPAFPTSPYLHLPFPSLLPLPSPDAPSADLEALATEPQGGFSPHTGLPDPASAAVAVHPDDEDDIAAGPDQTLVLSPSVGEVEGGLRAHEDTDFEAIKAFCLQRVQVGLRGCRREALRLQARLWSCRASAVSTNPM